MNLVKQLRTWDEMPEYDSDAFHWLDLKTAEAADLIERQAAQIEMMRGAMRRAADEIRKCDYTPARSTLLTSIASTPEQALEQFAAKVREQCARICEADMKLRLAAEIRAIKELP